MSRTFGETRNCAGCRFWSEMIAKCDGDGPVQAMCLGDGVLKSRYTTARQTCKSWKAGHLGAVDEPPNYGEAVRAAYAAEGGLSDGEVHNPHLPARLLRRRG